MPRVWKTAVDQLDKANDFAVATILSGRGPHLKRAGTRLLVLGDGSAIGTLGHGRLDGLVGDLALRALETKKSHRGIFPLCNDSAPLIQKTCQAEADLLIEYVDHTDPILQRIVRGLNRITAEHASAYFISEISLCPGEWSPYGIGHALLDTGRFRVGGFPGLLQLIESIRERKMLQTAQVVELGGWEQPVLLEWIKLAGTIYLFGTGRVGKWIARFASEVNFNVTVIDDRPAYASPEVVPEADTWLVTDSFHEALAALPIDEDAYLLAMPRHRDNDKALLAQALATRACFIGLIGSSGSTTKVLDLLRDEGFNEAQLSRILAPVGLSIGAETAEEIALSIVAELVRVRNMKAFEVR